MNSNIYDILKERGFIAQVSDEDALRRMLGGNPITFYVGFDSTATSLHAGSLVPIMAMKHLQQAGHRPIAIVGGGTTMVGDPSGKTEMRKMLSEENHWPLTMPIGSSLLIMWSSCVKSAGTSV